jgi:hypothetical protein
MPRKNRRSPRMAFRQAGERAKSNRIAFPFAPGLAAWVDIRTAGTRWRKSGFMDFADRG